VRWNRAFGDGGRFEERGLLRSLSLSFSLRPLRASLALSAERASHHAPIVRVASMILIREKTRRKVFPFSTNRCFLLPSSFVCSRPSSLVALSREKKKHKQSFSPPSLLVCALLFIQIRMDRSIIGYKRIPSLLDLASRALFRRKKKQRNRSSDGRAAISTSSLARRRRTPRRLPPAADGARVLRKRRRRRDDADGQPGFLEALADPPEGPRRRLPSGHEGRALFFFSRRCRLLFQEAAAPLCAHPGGSDGNDEAGAPRG